MQLHGPWKLARLHIPTGQRSEDIVMSGDTRHGAPPYKAVHTRTDFLELIAWANGQQPGVWQYWEGA